MNEFLVPIQLAEMLHVTLGTIADELHDEGNPWAATAKKVLAEYTRSRNAFLTGAHGERVIPEIAHHTFLAVERVCDVADEAIREAADFVHWASEVSGENA